MLLVQKQPTDHVAVSDYCISIVLQSTTKNSTFNLFSLEITLQFIVLFLDLLIAEYFIFTLPNLLHPSSQERDL